MVSGNLQLVKKSLLVFPPLLNKYRYLAHKVVDEIYFPFLCSFSIGQGDERRTLVGISDTIAKCCLPFKCVHEKIIHISEAKEKPVDCVCASRIKSSSPLPTQFVSSAVKKRDENMKDSDLSKEKRNAVRERNKRPDKLLYVPRALRAKKENLVCDSTEKIEAKILVERTSQQLHSQVVSEIKIIPSTSCQKEQRSPDSSYTNQDFKSKSFMTSDSLLKIDSDSQDASTSECDQIQSLKSVISDDCLSDLSSDSVLNDVEEKCDFGNKESTDSQAHLKANNLIRLSEVSSNSSFSEFTPNSSFSELSAFDQNSEMNVIYSDENPNIQDDESWESMFNDDGDCLNPDFVNELCKITGRLKVKIAKNKYSEYQPVFESVSEDYDYIVELFDFPVEFNTQDLISALSMFKQEAYTLKWVDDCHALAIFTNPTLANQALQLHSPFLKIRPLSEGIKESKAKARLCARSEEPSRPRPTTSAVLARRLVSGALGLKVKTSKEQRDMERTMLKEAKEKKMMKAKQRQDMWDGVVR